MSWDIEHPDITYIRQTGVRRGEYYPDGDHEEDEDDERIGEAYND